MEPETLQHHCQLCRNGQEHPPFSLIALTTCGFARRASWLLITTSWTTSWTSRTSFLASTPGCCPPAGHTWTCLTPVSALWGCKMMGLVEFSDVFVFLLPWNIVFTFFADNHFIDDYARFSTLDSKEKSTAVANSMNYMTKKGEGCATAGNKRSYF